MESRHVRRTGAALTLALSLALVLIPSAALRAQELSFFDVGARAAALGGAFTARADDITAVFYNPAGLAFLDGWRLKTNLTFGSRGIDASRSDNGLTYPGTSSAFRGDHFAAWQPVRRITLGLGFYSPYNFSTRWPRAYSLESVAISSKLNAQTLRSAVAFEPVKGLALSAAFDLVMLSVGWEHKIPFDIVNFPLEEPVEVTSFHELRGNGAGFAAGLLWKIFPWLQIGARYQSVTSVDMHGFNSFLLPSQSAWIEVPTPEGGYRSLGEVMGWYYTDQRVTGRMTMPRQIACGAALTPVRNLTFSFDLRWDGGSRFSGWDFTSVNEGGDLSPRFPIAYRELYGMEPDYGVQGLDLRFQDSKRIMAGVEYRLGKWLAFRAGYAKLGSAVAEADRTPVYPDPGFNVYSFGAGYEGPLFAIWDAEQAVSTLTFEFFVRYATSPAVTASYPGYDLTYSANRFTAGLGVGFAF